MEATSHSGSAADPSSWTFRRWASGLFGLDLRSLAVLRIGMALMLLSDLALRSRDLVAHYTDEGVLPRSLGSYPTSHLQFHDLSGTATYEAILFIAAALLALMMLVGFWTRLATCASWLFLCSVQARNPLTMDCGQDLMRLIMFWSIFLPLGARFSVDSALRIALPRRPNRIVSAATVALMLQVIFVYFFAYMLKTGADWRVNGSAVYYALSLDMLVTPIGRYLHEFPRLLRVLTFVVVGLEAITPLVFFFPWRNAIFRIVLMLLMSGMHLGFLLCMWIELFPLICIVAWLAFLPSCVWDALARWCRAPPSRGLAIYYDAQSASCQRFVLLLRELLILPGLRIRRTAAHPSIALEALKHNSWVLADARGNHLFGYDALLALARLSPVARPLAWLLSWRWVRRVGAALGRSAAKRRAALNTLSCPLQTWRPFPFSTVRAVLSPWERLLLQCSRWGLWAVGQAFVAVWIVYILAYNIEDMKYHAVRLRNADEWFSKLFLAIEEEPTNGWRGRFTLSMFIPSLFSTEEDPTNSRWDTWHLSSWLHDGAAVTYQGTPHRLDFYTLGRELRLEQYWAMFAPEPLKRDGWFVLSARLSDGTYVDLWTDDKVDDEKPADPAWKFPNYRWFKYMERFLDPASMQSHHQALCQYFCRQWNDCHPPSKQVRHLQILFIVEMSRPPYYPLKHERVLITECDCQPPAEPQD